MSSFTSELIVQPLPDGKNWELKRPFSYHVGSQYSREYIKVPVGFITDFASIPKFLWFLPYWAKVNKSAVLHDYLYQRKRIMAEKITRKQADDVWLEAMLVEWQGRKSRHFVAWLQYLAVRLFALPAWNRRS